MGLGDPVAVARFIGAALPNGVTLGVHTERQVHPQHDGVLPDEDDVDRILACLTAVHLPHWVDPGHPPINTQDEGRRLSVHNSDERNHDGLTCMDGSGGR